MVGTGLLRARAQPAPRRAAPARRVRRAVSARVCRRRRRCPGIGRSTAGAILALAREERFPILDGNARRVLARYFGVEGAPSDAAVPGGCGSWRKTARPRVQVAAYTQAIMDLGATVCVRRRPLCSECPLARDCARAAAAASTRFPPRAAGGARRAAARIHGGGAQETAARCCSSGARRAGCGEGCGACRSSPAPAPRRPSSGRRSGRQCRGLQPLGTVEHGFTHFDLTITPLLVRCAGAAARGPRGGGSLWYNIRTPARIGLPAPITALLAGPGAAASLRGVAGARRLKDPKCHTWSSA